MVDVRILLLGLVAAASPLAFASTFAVIKSGRGRLNSVVFAGAFLLGEVLVVVVVLALGTITVSRGNRNGVAALFELALGVLLLGAAWELPRRAQPHKRARSGRSQALLARLHQLKPAYAFAAGGLLGIGGPKRLTIGIVVASTVAAARLRTGGEIAIVWGYVAIAALLVWVPVAAYLVAGQQSELWMERAHTWFTAHERTATTVTLLVFGAFFAAEGLVRSV